MDHRVWVGIWTDSYAWLAGCVDPLSSPDLCEPYKDTLLNIQDTFVGYRVDETTVRIGVDLLDLADIVTPGKVIRMRDGAIGVRVERVADDIVTGVVLNDGVMGERKSAHFPDVTLHANPNSSFQDLQIIQEFAASNTVDFVAVSQVIDET